jgi:hypothetical protein
VSQSKKSGAERRVHPRIDNNVPLKIFHEGGDIVTETGNISRSGAYCKVNKYIAPMTKFKINLLLPVKKNGKTTSKKIACEGAVVRIEPSKLNQHYNVAIFFNDISQRDAESIADYVSSCLEKEEIH